MRQLARRSALVGYAELRRYTPLALARGAGRRGPDGLARDAVWERDGRRCQRCGRAWYLHLHHRLPRGYGGRNSPANLISLCPGCHEAVHRHPRVARAAGLLLPAGADPAAVPAVVYGRGLVWLTDDAQAVPVRGNRQPHVAPQCPALSPLTAAAEPPCVRPGGETRPGRATGAQPGPRSAQTSQASRSGGAPGEGISIMAKTTVVIHPKPNGVWPDGEPQSVRDTADAQQATGKQR